MRRIASLLTHKFDILYLNAQFPQAGIAAADYTVVGVVGDVRDSALASAPLPMLYRAQAVPVAPMLEPGARRTLALVVNASAPSEVIVPAIRKIVAELDPTVPIFNVQSMHEVLRASTAKLTLAITLITAAAVITLLLGGIGLYGVLAYACVLRTREFGIRIALGAEPKQIARWVASHGLALSVSGIALGFALYALLAPLLRRFLFGVTPNDPVTLITVTLLLLLTALLASILPARRAAKIAPTQALRAP
jgi:putative ABC transport system permease protein